MCAPGWMSRTLVALQMHVRVRQRAVVTSESIGFAYATRIRCYEVTVLYTRSRVCGRCRCIGATHIYVIVGVYIVPYSFLRFAPFFGLQAREPRNGAGQLHLELDLAVGTALGCAARRVAVARRPSRGRPRPPCPARGGPNTTGRDIGRARLDRIADDREAARGISLCDGQSLSAISHVPRTCACQM